MANELIREAMGVADTPLKELMALQAALEYLDVCIRDFNYWGNVEDDSNNPIKSFSYTPDRGRISFAIAFENGSYSIIGGTVNDDNVFEVGFGNPIRIANEANPAEASSEWDRSEQRSETVRTNVDGHDI